MAMMEMAIMEMAIMEMAIIEMAIMEMAISFYEKSSISFFHFSFIHISMRSSRVAVFRAQRWRWGERRRGVKMERDTDGTVKRMAKIAEYKDGTVDGWHSARTAKMAQCRG